MSSAQKPKNPIDDITENAMERLLRRAGVKRISTSTYPELRRVMEKKVREIVATVITYTEYDRRRTVMESDIQAAAEQLGTTLAVGLNKKAQHTKNLQRFSGEIRKTGASGKKAKPGVVALRKIKKYQKDSDTLLIPKQNFKRLVKYLARENFSSDEKLRFQKDVILLIQVWVEEYVVKMGSDANLLTLHAGRETLSEKDLKLVQTLRSRC